MLNLTGRLTSRGMASSVVVLLAVIPLLFVIGSSLQLDLAGWRGLWSERLPMLFSNTIVLAVLVALGSFLLGVSSAWWISRRQFVGRALAIWLMILPLTIPT
ncbi:MAG: hypothetical protein R6X06_01690 [Gammaproteobacteria bacterium]